MENGWKLFVGWVVCFWLKAFAKKIPPKKGEIKIRFQGGGRERERESCLSALHYFLSAFCTTTDDGRGRRKQRQVKTPMNFRIGSRIGSIGTWNMCCRKRRRPRRLHLASESNSVTSITYVTMLFWPLCSNKLDLPKKRRRPQIKRRHLISSRPY